MDIVSKLCITALYVISKSCFTNISIFDTISFTDIYFISYTVCISDPDFRARKTAYAEQLDQERHEMVNQVLKFKVKA